MAKKAWVRYLWLVLGTIFFVLGTIGIALPILPTVPFYLLTMFCYSKGSPRLHRWFISTNFYKKHLLDFTRGRGMTVYSKVSVMVYVTLLMGVGFYFMDYFLLRTFIVLVWLVHVYVIVFYVKTID